MAARAARADLAVRIARAPSLRTGRSQSLAQSLGKAASALLVALSITLAVFSRGPYELSAFDGEVYLSIAYDLDRHGVFSNGALDGTDSSRLRPEPGMFYTPVYPALLALAMRLDPRFAAAARCTVEATRADRGISPDASAIPGRSCSSTRWP